MQCRNGETTGRRRLRSRGEAGGGEGDQTFDAGGEPDEAGRTKLMVGGDAETREHESVERMSGIRHGDVFLG